MNKKNISAVLICILILKVNAFASVEQGVSK